MANSPISILFLCTAKSREYVNPDLNNILAGLRNTTRFRLELRETFDETASLLGLKGREFHVVVVHCHSSEGDLWRRVFYKTKTNNKFSEVIAIVVDPDEKNKIEAGQVLSGGCFAFFQYTFSAEVLFGYIEAARRKYENRQIRAKLSLELSAGSLTAEGVATATVEDAVRKIANQLETLTRYKNITITLLKKGRTEQGYLRKLVYTNLDRNGGRNGIKWQLLKPTEEDALVKQILSGDIERRIFPNPREDQDIKTLFDVEHETPQVNSWIALPLRHAGIPIGLITLDGFDENWFNYEDINELFLEQIANQAATAIRYAEKDEVHQRLGEALNALNSSTDLNEILEKLAEQACKLVGGLFSYIVVPDEAQTRLEFRGAWSRNDKKGFINKLKTQVVFPDPNDNTLKPGFLLPPYNSTIEKKGITTRAFTTCEKQLLENIRDENYQEISAEAKTYYYPHPYLYKDENGKERTILSSSDIALPILLKTKQSPFSSSQNMALGVINVEHEEPFAFTNEQIGALEQLAEFAAIAIHNKKKQAFISELHNQSDFPYEENLSFQSTELFLNRAAQKLRNATQAKEVSVYSVKDNKSFFIGKTTQNIKEGSRWGDKEGHTFWCIRNKKPVVINNTGEYMKSPEKFRDLYGECYLREDMTPIRINELTTNLETIQAMVCIPMALPNHDVIGVIWILYETSPEYTKEDIEHLKKFASRLANTLNVIEKITFLKIENEIGMAYDRESVLEKIVESAKHYFGLRGAAIYEANPEEETLTRVKSNIKQFYSNETIHYSEENTQGLAGHLMRGIDIGGYSYESGYCHIPEYTLSKYAHAIQYYDAERIKELGSVVGIRMPSNSTSANSVGVLILADEVGRKYDKSKEDLLRFADIAGKCLKAFKDEETFSIASIDASQLESQKRIEGLQEQIANQEKALSVANRDKERVEKEKNDIKQEVNQLEQEITLTKNINWWIILILFGLPTFCVIWFTDFLGRYVAEGQNTLAKLSAQLLALSIWWLTTSFVQRKKWSLNKMLAIGTFLVSLLQLLGIILEDSR